MAKLTKNQKQFKKEFQRINAIVEKAKDEGKIPSGYDYSLPSKKTKNITQSYLNELKSVGEKEILNSFKSKYTQAAFFNAVIISNFRRSYSYVNSTTRFLIDSWLSDLMIKYTSEEIAYMLNEANKSNHILTFEIMYDDRKLTRFLDEMEEYLPISESLKQKINNQVQEDQEFVSYD